ncbi:MAG: peptide chain release factor N(5)-glutamine methyltransferase [Heliobacteriaceae bacterium]|jgi:release factor glutamine methyltransferase|nr:peptide chain release factor N(5)-glutamine methyltransferase [Heliobacteriaceae bacterium]
MSIQEIVQILIDSGIEPNEANIEVKMLIERFCGFSAMDLILGKKLDYEKLGIVREKAALRARTKRPIQHITGFADFMGEKFIVNEHVLIPRDETEILVRKAIELLPLPLGEGWGEGKAVLDIGTGSGCIACMLAKLTGAQVIGVDISTEALNTALDNASRLNLFNKAIFRKSDVFSNVREKFDVIVSNPPYIPPGTPLQQEVKFDPKIALFTKDEKGLEFYEKICAGAPEFLKEGGYLLFELGAGQSQVVKLIMESCGFGSIEIIQDLAGIDRVIAGRLEV